MIHKIETFDGSLTTTPPPDQTPPPLMRRNRGIHSIRSGSARSRWGSTLITALLAHSIFRWNASRYAIASTTLYKDGVSIKTGLSGSRAAWVVGAPTVGKPDHLFLCDGANMLKVNAAGTVQTWGIAPFDVSDFTGTAQANSSRSVHSIDGTTGGWTAGTGVTLGANSDLYVNSGEDSLEVACAIGQTFYQTWTNTLDNSDLTTYGSDTSPDEDYIQLWVRFETTNNLSFVQLSFARGGTGYDSNGNANDEYVAIIPFVSDPSVLQHNIRGVARQFGNDEQRRLVQHGETPRVDLSSLGITPVRTASDDGVGPPRILTPQQERLIGTAASTVENTVNVWWRLRVPKYAFQSYGSGTADWSNVTGIKLGIATSQEVTTAFEAYFDDIDLSGGAGLRGRYRYYFRARNSTTGETSSHTDYLEVENIDRQPVALTLPTTHPDTQVDQIEIWRTFGDGGLPFLCSRVALGTSTFTDTVADFYGMNTAVGAETLGPDEMNFDHVTPEGTYHDAVGLHHGRIWCLDSAATRKGRILYTRPGELGVMQGALQVTDDDDALQKLVLWNRALYAWSKRGVYIVTGTEQPFIPVKIREVPGTEAPKSVLPTPYGIVYESFDGFRIFDGQRSTVAPSLPLVKLFRGEAQEGMPAWSGTLTAAAGLERYMASDGTTTLELDAQLAWRNLGIGAQALDYETDTGYFTASFGSSVVVLEDEGVLDDAGTAINFEAQHGFYRPTRFPVEHLLRRVTFDVKTNGQQLTPYIILHRPDGSMETLALAPLACTDRKLIEYALDEPALAWSARLAGPVTDQVEWFAAVYDYNEGSESPQ